MRQSQSSAIVYLARIARPLPHLLRTVPGDVHPLSPQHHPHLHHRPGGGLVHYVFGTITQHRLWAQNRSIFSKNIWLIKL